MAKSFSISLFLATIFGLLPYIASSPFLRDGLDLLYIPIFVISWPILFFLFKFQEKERSFWSVFWRLVLVPFFVISVMIFSYFFIEIAKYGGGGEAVGWGIIMVIGLVIILGVFLFIINAFGWLISNKKIFPWVFYILFFIALGVLSLFIYTRQTLAPCTTQNYSMQDWGYLCRAPSNF